MNKRFLLPGGRLDRYVLMLFGASYSVAFFLVVGLFLIINLAGNLDEYFEPGEDGTAPSGALIAKYYLYNTPFIYLQVAPFVTMIAGLFTASKLVRNNEVVAALGAGISAQRLIAPILVGGLALAAAMFGLREFATESIGFRRDLALDRIVERREVPVYTEIWVVDPHAHGSNIVQVERFMTGGSNGAGARVDGLVATIKREDRLLTVSADVAIWSDSQQRWILEGAELKVVEGPEEDATAEDVLADVRFTPRDVHTIWKGQSRPLDLSFRETTDLWRRDPDNSQLQTLVEYHKTFPLANVFLLLVALPFLVRHERGRQIEKVALGFVLCVFYFAADFITRSLGMQGNLSPLMASWLPVLFFGSLGVVFFSSMKS